MNAQVIRVLMLRIFFVFFRVFRGQSNLECDGHRPLLETERMVAFAAGACNVRGSR